MKNFTSFHPKTQSFGKAVWYFITYNEHVVPVTAFQNLLICFLIYPVVAVYDFEKYARCISQSRIDSFAMTAIFLMDRAADTGIALFIFICDLSRPVLCGTVIYDQNLHLIPSSEKRTDAVLHISF